MHDAVPTKAINAIDSVSTELTLVLDQRLSQLATGNAPRVRG